MDRSYLRLVAFTLILSACNGQIANTNGGSFGPGGNYREVTDVHTCTGKANNPTIYKNWHRSFMGTTDTADLEYQILPGNRTRVTQTCHFANGTSINATVDVESIVDLTNSKYGIKNATQYTQTTAINGTQYNCTVSTQAFNAPFTFQGNCFGLAADGQVTWFLPAQ